jgi:hypothetical protein
MKTVICAAFLTLASLGVSSAAVIRVPQVTYTLDVDFTKNGNDVGQVLIVERYGANSIRFSKKGFIASEGETMFWTDYVGQYAAAIVGIEDPSPIDTLFENSTHVLFAMNSMFAGQIADMTDKRFSQVFPPSRHSHFIADIRAYYDSDDADAMARLTSFFLNEGSGAMFTPGQNFSVLEFSVGTPIGSGGSTVPTPEPSTFALMFLGAAAVAWRKHCART